MAKNLTLFILLLNLCFLNAQEKLVFAEGTAFHELPGNHFLTSFISNTKVYLNERTADGASVWVDSLEFSVPVEEITKCIVSRFGNTDQYAVILHKMPFQTDLSNIYQFAKLDLSTHTLTNHFTDTIPGYYPAIPIAKNDTSTYLFFPW